MKIVIFLDTFGMKNETTNQEGKNLLKKLKRRRAKLLDAGYYRGKGTLNWTCEQ